MRIKVITKDHGEFISDPLTEVDADETSEIVNRASIGTLSNLQFKYNGGRIYFTEEVMKTSVFIVFKD